MQVNSEGRELIKQFEGLSLKAYRCPAGIATIGFGHTAGVQMDDLITGSQADFYLASDLAAFGQNVERLLTGTPTTQHEFNALVSLAFNVGISGFGNSTVLRLHKAGDKAGAARSFGMWNKATVSGKLQELPGLTRRRATEAAFYLTPDVEDKTAMPQAVAPPVERSKTVMAGVTGAVAAAASVSDQLGQVTPIIDQVSRVGASLSTVLQLSGLALSIIAFAAVMYMLLRYIDKRRNGQVVST